MSNYKHTVLLLCAMLAAPLWGCGKGSGNGEVTAQLQPIEGALSVANPAHVNWYGRTYQNDGEQGVYFNNTLSGFEVRLSGAELTAELYASAACWLTVFYNGMDYPEYAQRVKLAEGTHRYALATGLPAGVHSVKVLRSTENTEANRTRLIALSAADGEAFYAPPAKPQRRVELYGASTFCGHGSIGRPGEAYSIDNSDGAHTMGYYAAYRLGAQVSALCASGWGLGVGPVKSIPNASYRYSNTDTGTWDVSRYEPEVTVLNVGYNDSRNLGVKGTPQHEQNAQLFVDKLKAFVQLIRARHPHTFIYVTCGIYADAYEQEAYPLFAQAVQELHSEGELRLKLLRFSPMLYSEAGANNHPGWAAHRRMGAVLADDIARELGWDIVNNR